MDHIKTFWVLKHHRESVYLQGKDKKMTCDVQQAYRVETATAAEKLRAFVAVPIAWNAVSVQYDVRQGKVIAGG